MDRQGLIHRVKGNSYSSSNINTNYALDSETNGLFIEANGE